MSGELSRKFYGAPVALNTASQTFAGVTNYP